MIIHKIPCLNELEINVDVGTDGPSLPILCLTIRYRSKTYGSALLDKEQVELLTRTLQALQSEM